MALEITRQPSLVDLAQPIEGFKPLGFGQLQGRVAAIISQGIWESVSSAVLRRICFERDSFQASLTEAEQDLQKMSKAETA